MPAPYPLAWPDHIARWKPSRETGSFKATLAAAMANVKDSLRRFGNDSGVAIKDVVISSNVTLGTSNPSDPGVAIWFEWDGRSICIPVDRYSKVEANLQAIHHIIEARRTELRHGTLALVRASFSGFAALPAPGQRGWRDVMGIYYGSVSESDIEKEFRKLAKERHPDAGGSEAEMAALNAAREAALQEIRGRK